jgi:hypothetical protein
LFRAGWERNALDFLHGGLEIMARPRTETTDAVIECQQCQTAATNGGCPFVDEINASWPVRHAHRWR